VSASETAAATSALTPTPMKCTGVPNMTIL
jgi:hypothetical protein